MVSSMQCDFAHTVHARPRCTGDTILFARLGTRLNCLAGTASPGACDVFLAYTDGMPLPKCHCLKEACEKCSFG